MCGGGGGGGGGRGAGRGGGLGEGGGMGGGGGGRGLTDGCVDSGAVEHRSPEAPRVFIMVVVVDVGCSPRRGGQRSYRRLIRLQSFGDESREVSLACVGDDVVDGRLPYVTDDVVVISDASSSFDRLEDHGADHGVQQ